MSTSAVQTAPPANTDGSKKRLPKVLIAVAVVLVILMLWFLTSLLKSQSVEEVHSEYGQRNGYGADDSVNGTSVLAGMFQQRGFTVSSWPRISPKLDKCDTIVWFPNAFDPPSDQARQKLEEWLRGGKRRTLVYVGRDYDAEVAYWRMMQSTVAADERDAINKRLTEAQVRYQTQRGKPPREQAYPWFTLRGQEPQRTVNQLEGPWSAGVDGSKTWIELRTRIDPPQTAYAGQVVVDELLVAPGSGGTDDDVLALRLTNPYAWRRGQIIVVANGSFLLNMPLVNHEHRKLAGHLIAECQPGKVVFLESGPQPIAVRDKDPTSTPSWEFLTMWPLSPVFLHIATWGILLCFALFPLFGRSYDPKTDSSSDFGKHIDALGALLAKTQDRNYAQARVTYYHEKVRRDSGSGHADPRKAESGPAVATTPVT